MKKRKTSKRHVTHNKSDESTIRHPHRWGCCLLQTITFIIALLLVSVLLISSYVFYASVCPNLLHKEQFTNSSMTDEECLAQLFSDYPYVRPWYRKLLKNELLRETEIYSNSDSTLLHAYYIQAKSPTTRTAIVIHGYKSCALDIMYLAYMYQHDLGFNVLIPDLRTHGQSQGSYIGFGWIEQNDIIQWAETCSQLFANEGNDKLQIIVHGVSMGAATAMFVAGNPAHPPTISIYIEDCGYSSVYDEIAYVAHRDYAMNDQPFVNIASQFCQWIYGWNFRQASCIESLKKSHKPMLFIHGTADRYVPFEMAQQLYEAKPNNKEIWEVKDVIHARSYHDRKDEYTQRVSAFINQYLYGSL